MARKAYVVGVGMTKFEKPGAREWDYPDMAKESIEAALADSGIPYDRVDQAVASYVMAFSTAGEHGLYQVGMSGIPVYNVSNNCSSGSTAMMMARNLVAGDMADVVLAFGFEKMQKGSLGGGGSLSGANPIMKHMEVMINAHGYADAPPMPQIFGNAGREHAERYGTTNEMFAAVGEKNHRHSVNNPNSQFRDQYTLQEVLDAPMVYDPLTKLQCSPTSDGGAAAVIVSEKIVREFGLEAQAVEIVAQAMATDFGTSFEGSMIKLVGADLTRAAAQKVYAESGLGPEDIDVIELHDCFSANELITYEGLGLCPEGKSGDLVMSGATTYGGEWVINPSGGLISKGHPIGATGVAQCAELSWHLRGIAGDRQVEGAKVALQHNLGLGGAAVVSMYKMGEFA